VDGKLGVKARIFSKSKAVVCCGRGKD